MSAYVDMKMAYVSLTPLRLINNNNNNPVILPPPQPIVLNNVVEKVSIPLAKDKESVPATATATTTAAASTKTKATSKAKGRAPPKKAPQTKSRKRKRNTKTLEDLFQDDELKVFRCEYCEKPFTQPHLLDDHRNICINNTPNPNNASRENETKKADFFSILGLISAANVVNGIYTQPTEVFVPPRPLSTTSEKYRKSQINSYFKTSAVPLSNPQSLRLIQHGIGNCVDGEQCVQRYEEFCSPKRPAKSRSRNKTKSSRIKKEKPVEYQVIQSKKYKSKIKEGDYVHKYCFNRYQKIKRDNEIIIGLKMKSFKLLNKCKPLKVKVEHMKDSEIAAYLNKLALKRVGNSPPKSGIPRRILITIPLKQECSVELDDIKFQEEYSQWFKN